MIAAGAAGVHWEDQLASEKKCGHLGGKVLIPTGQHIKTLSAARLAADVCGVPVADRGAHRRPGRDADHQRRRRAGPAVRHRRADGRGLLPGPQRHRRLHRPRPGLRAVLRPAVDGDLDARTCRSRAEFAEAIQIGLPGPDAGLQLLAVVQLAGEPGRRHDRQVPARAGRDGLQVPVHHPGRIPRAELLDVRRWPAATPSAACRPTCELQDAEFAAEADGYTATKHQREVGTGYFDQVTSAINPDAVDHGAGRLDRSRRSSPPPTRPTRSTGAAADQSAAGARRR